MKNNLLLPLAVALLGAASLLPLSACARVDSDFGRDPVRLRVDVDRTVLPAETPGRAVIKIALHGMRLPHRHLRPPVNLALVIDRSGSMGGDKISKAREAALEAVRRLGPDDIVALIAYDSRVETLVPAQRVGDGRRLESAIHRLAAGGNTALHGGVIRGAAEIRRNLEDRRYVNRVILLSDGLANVGPHSPEELGRLGASLQKEGISVTTIGLGLGFNEDLMTRLAQRSDGNTYFVEDSADLPRIFAAELGDVLNVIARGVVIEIEFPSWVRPLRFVGREGVIRGQQAGLTINQLYGGQERFALIEVEVSPGAPGTEREIAQARMRYEDVVTGRKAEATADRSVSFSASREEVIGSADHKVQADYAVNVIAVAKDEAIALVDADKREEAGRVLRQRTDELQKMSQVYGNDAVGKVAAAAPSAASVERDGLSNEERKRFRAEAAQTRSQQSAGSGQSPDYR